MNYYIRVLFFFLSMMGAVHAEGVSQDNKTVLLAILAKNKAHVLPKFLECIDTLEYNKKLVTVYVNTNNNTDNTSEILENWAKKNGPNYARVIFESHHVTEDKETRPHEWTAERFKVLGTIRNKSMQKTKECNCDYYFVVDCDNFIAPCTLRELIAKDKPIVAPMLYPKPEMNDVYSNFFCSVTERGYYAHHDNYIKILNREVQGTFEVPVVHCTYLIKSKHIDDLTYVDDTDDYEFVIFSRSARKNGIGQYICNEKDFGWLVHFFEDVSLEEERNRVKALLAQDSAISCSNSQ